MSDMRAQIKERMTDEGVTGVELARLMGSSDSYLSRWLNSKKMTSEAYQDKAIACLGGTVPEVKTPVVEWSDNGCGGDRVQRTGQGAHSEE